MNKLLHTIGLAAISLASMQAQGTIQFANSFLTPVKIVSHGGFPAENLPTTIAVNFGVFFRTSAEASWQGPVLPLGTSSTTTAGMITVPNTFAYEIPGTSGGQTISMQIAAWNASFGNDAYGAWQSGQSLYDITDVREITLGAPNGPGNVIWQPLSGNNPNMFYPIVLGKPFALPPPPVVPEPSTFVLAALGVLVLLFRWRKSELK